MSKTLAEQYQDIEKQMLEHGSTKELIAKQNAISEQMRAKGIHAPKKRSFGPSCKKSGPMKTVPGRYR